MRITSFATICLILIINCKAQSNWNEDIAFLKNELPKKHKNLFFQLDKQSFDRDLDLLSSCSDSMSNLDFALSLQKIIAKVGDSHTGVGYSYLLDQSKRLPFATVFDSLKTLVVQDNEALNKLYLPKLVIYTQILSFFGFAPNDSTALNFALINKDGNAVQEEISPDPNTGFVAATRKTIPLSEQNRKDVFWEKYLDNSTYYIQYNACTGKEVAKIWGQETENLPSFNDFSKQIFATVDKKKIKRFIFDMRFNGGGHSLQGTEFVEKIKKNKKINKKGVLYVIIGRDTFSSAIINTMDFKDKTQAIIVGEETGGMPNHYGDVKLFRLPSSGVYVQYSTKYFRFTQQNLNTITPDIKVTYNFTDYMNGVDPSVNEIMKGEI